MDKIDVLARLCYGLERNRIVDFIDNAVACDLLSLDEGYALGEKVGIKWEETIFTP